MSRSEFQIHTYCQKSIKYHTVLPIAVEMELCAVLNKASLLQNLLKKNCLSEEDKN
jgi:hypothetical protein